MSYESLIETAGVVVEDSAHVGDYQGDLYMIVRDAYGRYGYVVTGYGSCSGCDAYEAAHDNDVYSEDWEDTYEIGLADVLLRKPEGELVQLRDSILSGITWVDNQADLAVLLAQDLSENSKGLRWYYSDDAFRAWALSMIDKYTVKQED